MKIRSSSSSPLLFCLALTPLSMLLDTLNGYQATSTKQVNHLLYMDDLKLFAKTDVQLERLLHVVHMFSSDICLTFGLDKCAKSSVTRGKIVSSDDITLSDDCPIHVLGVGETYKYLGFHKAEGLDCAKSKELIINSYKSLSGVRFSVGLERPEQLTHFVFPSCPMASALFFGASQK